MKKKRKSTRIALLLCFEAIIVAVSWSFYQSVISYYLFPECNPTPFEQRKAILEEVPYVYGNTRKITEQSITIQADFRYLNRWKCEDMRSPYQEVVGDLTKNYTITITPDTQIIPIGDSRYRYVPNDHRPEFLPEPKKILERINEEPEREISLEEILRDNQVIAVTEGEAALTTDSFTASLIMVDPHRNRLYNFGVQMGFFITLGLLLGVLLRINSEIAQTIWPSKHWQIREGILRTTLVITFIIWYVIQIS